MKCAKNRFCLFGHGQATARFWSHEHGFWAPAFRSRYLGAGSLWRRAAHADKAAVALNSHAAPQ